MGWRAQHFCEHCDKTLSHRVLYYNSGVCNHCGHSANSTICDYVIRPRRWIRTNSRWLFWKNVGHWEYMEGEPNATN